jgi:hypothetical protein
MILGAQAATPMVEAPRAIIAGALVGLGTSGAYASVPFAVCR